MIKTLLAAVLCLLAARGALAQDQGFTADFGGMNQDGVPNEIYTQLLPSHVSYNTFPRAASSCSTKTSPSSPRAPASCGSRARSG
jgi:hypothetical protein